MLNHFYNCPSSIFNYSIDELPDCNLSWSSKTIASLTEKLDNFGVPIRKNDYTKKIANNSDARCLLIRMTVVDAQNCQGPQVNVTVPIHRTDVSDVSDVRFDI